MKTFLDQVSKQIERKYGTRKAWLDKNKIHPQRFYNFLKGKYNPTILTLNSWLKTLDLELVTKHKKKGR